MKYKAFSVFAVFLFIILPFGGQIQALIPPTPFCTYPVIVVKMLRGGKFGYAPLAITSATQIGRYGKLYPPNWVIGLFSTSPACIYALTLTRVGTSY